MRKVFLSSLFCALLASVSLGVVAAPAAPAPAAQVTAPSTATKTEQMGAAININKADAETLQRELSGIGKGKADAIVAYREANGEFTSIDELIEVKGIGKAIFEKNRDKLTTE